MAPHAERIDSAALQLLAAAKACPGLALAVYTRDWRHVAAHGVADATTGTPVTPATRFYIASCTKALTALSFSELHQRGELPLESTLAELSRGLALPSDLRAEQVTLRHLLTHSHGLVNRPLVHRLAYTGVHDEATRWRLLGALRPNVRSPLETFQYGNVGYNVASILAERRLGQSWRELLSRCVFDPIGMESATTRAASPDGGSFARPHQLDVAGMAQRTGLEKVDATLHSAGGVFMSAMDALHWMQVMVEDGRLEDRYVLSRRTVLATRESLIQTAVDGSGYGLGWRVARHQGEPACYHTGDFPGWAAMVGYLPLRGVGVAVFTNGDRLGGRVADALLHFVLGLAGQRSDASAMLDAATRALTDRRQALMHELAADRARRRERKSTLTLPPAGYAGRYASEDWGEMDVRLVNSDLRVHFGVMQALAEPGDRPDSILAELIPGTPSILQFQQEGSRAVSLRYGDQTFLRQ